MQEKQQLEMELEKTLAVLKEKVDSTMAYLDKHPEDTDYMVKLWGSSIRSFLNYGVKKSETKGGDNLFKRVSRMLIFGK